MSEAEWSVIFRQLNTLGLWHATQILKYVNTVKDPVSLAHDVTQDAWETICRKGLEPTKGLFVTMVIGLAHNAARDSRPVEITYKADPNSRRSRLTGTFPTQIFATSLADIDVRDEACGSPKFRGDT